MCRNLLISLLCACGLSVHAFALTIHFSEAEKHVGEEVIVNGKTSQIRTLPSGMTFLNFGARGKPGSFTAVARPGTVDAEKIKEFEGKAVEVSGTITLYKDSPQIVLKSDADIRLRTAAPAEDTDTKPAADPESEPEKMPESTQAAPKMETFDVDLDRSEIRSIGRIPDGKDPATASAAVALPAEMDSAKPYPVLAVFPDFHHDSDLEKLITPYAKIANPKDWIVLTARGSALDFDLPPAWHAAMIQAALRKLETDHPGISNWPLYLAGNADGAGRASFSIGAFLDKKADLRGCFLSSLKREELTKSVETFAPSKSKLKKVKIFVSQGNNDGMVSQEESTKQSEKLRKAGAKNVQYEIHQGRTGIDAPSLEKAIEWFEATE